MGFQLTPSNLHGINLFLSGEISINFVYIWPVMDTNDDWAPKHDHPVSKRSGNILFLCFRNMVIEWMIFANLAKGILLC